MRDLSVGSIPSLVPSTIASAQIHAQQAGPPRGDHPVGTQKDLERMFRGHATGAEDVDARCDVARRIGRMCAIAHQLLDGLGITTMLMHARAGSGDWQPALWTREIGSGRVAVDTLGHDAGVFDHVVHRRIVARAALWALARGDPEIGRA